MPDAVLAIACCLFPHRAFLRPQRKEFADVRARHNALIRKHRELLASSDSNNKELAAAREELAAANEKITAAEAQVRIGGLCEVGCFPRVMPDCGLWHRYLLSRYVRPSPATVTMGNCIGTSARRAKTGTGS
jgi:hypothetical protein